MATEADTLEQWFNIADTNRDGRIEGTEAITFFQKSGLPRKTLKDVWERTAGTTPFMTKQQFYGAIRLVSLAQLSGGAFTPQQATQLLTGTSQPPPLPMMAGLTANIWSPDKAVTSPTFQQAQPTMQYTGGGSIPPSVQVTGQPPAMQYTGYSAPPAPSPMFPPLPMEEFTRYGHYFQSLDTDNDGLLHGGQCIEVFSSRGVDREVLRQIWQVIAGSAGQINRDQFTKCLYLIELSRRGIPLPTSLPVGQFPPIAQMPTGHTESTGFVSGGGAIPSLPATAVFQPQEPAAYPGWRGPTINEGFVSTLDPTQRDRLTNEKLEAQRKDQEFYRIDKEAETARQKKELFEIALQELTLFKSRMDVATMEVQEQVKREREAAEEMENRYNQIRSGAEAASRESGSHIQALNEAQNKKSELQTRLQEIKTQLADLEKTHPETIQKLETEIQYLQETVASTENKRNALVAELESFKHQQELLHKRQGDLQMACAAAEAEVHSASGDIDKLVSEVESSKDTKDVEQIQKLLREAARIYSNVYSHACKAGVEIPVEAKMSLYGNENAWTDDLISAGIDTTDWQEDGFVLVDVFPDVKEDLDAEFEKAIQQAVQDTEENKTMTTSDSFQQGGSGFENAFSANLGPPKIDDFASFDAFPPPQTNVTTPPVPPTSGFAVSFDEPGAFTSVKDQSNEMTGFDAFNQQRMTTATTTVTNPPIQSTPLADFGFDDKPPVFETSFPAADFKSETTVGQSSKNDESKDPFGGSAFS